MLFARRALASLVGLVAVASVAGPALAQESQEPSSSTVTVVHAVPGNAGFPADIYLNGEIVIDSMVFEGMSAPAEVLSGPVGLQIFRAGADPAADAPLIDQVVTLDAGADYTAVAQLVDGAPAVALYLNDISPVPAGGARFTIRQSSSEGPLEVMMGDVRVVKGLVAPNEATVEVEAGTVSLAILAADGVGLIERNVDIRPGSLLVVYAVGSTAQNTFALLTQQVTTPQETPEGIPTGTGGTREMATRAGWLSVPGMFVAAVLLVVRPRKSRAF